MRPLRKHIVLLTRVLPHHGIGGMQVVAWDLARAFSERDHKVTIVTAEIPGKPMAFADGRIEIRTIPGVSWRFYGRRWWRESRRLFESELAETCDVVLSVSAAGAGLLSLRWRFPRIPFVMQAHGTSLGEVISKLRSRRVKSWLSSLRNVAWMVKDILDYRRFDAVVAVGPKVYGDIQGLPYRWTFDTNGVELIPNGIDTSVFCPNPFSRNAVREELGWSQADLIAISVGRLHKQKGVELSLDGFAMAASCNPGLRLIIAGDGPERVALEHRVDSLGLRARVHFLGEVGREALPRYLQAADLMLFTTTHVEVGLPLNVLEALAVGIPVIASGHLEGIRGGDLGIKPIDPHVPCGIAEAIEDCLSAKTGIAVVLPARYSIDACVSSYLDLFTRLQAERALTEESARA